MTEKELATLQQQVAAREQLAHENAALRRAIDDIRDKAKTVLFLCDKALGDKS